ncbi:hypothetical protein ACM66B_003967 [Microbotryomycetes sp. NB124-2]
MSYGGGSPHHLDTELGHATTSGSSSRDNGGTKPQRAAAIASLRRAASAREVPTAFAPLSDPVVDTKDYNQDVSLFQDAGPSSLERTASLLARSMAMAKLTGTAPPTAAQTFLHPSRSGFSTQEALPSLDTLRERAQARVKAAEELGLAPPPLRRNHTVTGVGGAARLLPMAGTQPPNTAPSPSLSSASAVGLGVFGSSFDEPSLGAFQSASRDQTNDIRSSGDGQGQERTDARTNLMRKLSARKLSGASPTLSRSRFDTSGDSNTGSGPESAQTSPDMRRLQVAGQRGRTRPRSGSVGSLDWRQGGPSATVPEDVPDVPRVPSQHLASSTSQHSLSTSSPSDRHLVPSPAQTQRFMPSPSITEATPRTVQHWDITPRPNTHSTRFAPSPLELSPKTDQRRPRTGDSTSSPRRSSHPASSLLLPNHAGVSALATSSLGIKDARKRPAPSFGIRAVEDDVGDVRRRGSSASSSVAFLEARRRGSDGDHRNLSYGGARSAGGSFDSSVRLVDYIKRSGSGSSSMLLSRGSLSGGEDNSAAGSTSSAHNGSEIEEIASVAGQQTDQERSIKEQRLVEKVERKREQGLTRSREGAFPPPEHDYRFPGGPGAKPAAAWQGEASQSQPIPIHERRSRTSPFLPSYAPVPVRDGTPASPVVPVEPISPTSELPPGPALISRAALTRSDQSKDSWMPTTSPTTRSVPLPPVDESAVPRAIVESPSSRHSWSSDMQRDHSGGSSVDSETYLRSKSMAADDLPASRILSHLDKILGLAPEQDPQHQTAEHGSLLDQPPRKLLLHTPVLQVVNANTVKDRHLFLFSDLLLIAKPIIIDGPDGEPVKPDLSSSFIVKSVVELSQLKVMAAEDPLTSERKRAARRKEKQPGLSTFIDRFANDPRKAIASLVQRGGLANDAVSIASCIFTNPELDREQVGSYLAAPENRQILRAFIERFRLGGVRIDDALRLFLMSLRLPTNNAQVAEYVLSVFAMTWTEVNGSSGFDPSLTTNLALAIMQLSDALHSGNYGNDGLFAAPNPDLSVDEWIANFRKLDPRMLVPEDLLTRIYASVRRERIEQGSDNSIFSMTPDIECEMSYAPSALTYRTPSEPITITIPEPDQKFVIKLHGTDLKFDPPILSFAKSATQSFRVTGTSLGSRAMVLIKMGANAPRYQGLPLNKAFLIERAFMQHTFQVSFTNHLDVKRKYMFSTLSADRRAEWLQAMRHQTALCLRKPRPASAALEAGEAVAVQVLRDSLIQPDEPVAVLSSAAPSPRPNTAAPRFGTASAAAAAAAAAATTLPVPATPTVLRNRQGTPTRAGPGALARSHSTSRIYAALYKHESDLGVDNSTGSNGTKKSSLTTTTTRRGSRDDPTSAALTAALLSSNWSKTGDEIVLTSEQNSLLPVVLSFLGSGLPAAPHPVSYQGSAFQISRAPVVASSNRVAIADR